jgi:hypothetical protein
MKLDLQLSFYPLRVITVDLTVLYSSVYVLQMSYYILILWYHLNVGEKK